MKKQTKNLILRQFIEDFNLLMKQTYCLKGRKNTESKNLKVVKTNIGKIVLLSNCTVCNSKKSRSIKEQEASWLLKSLGILNLK